MEEVILSQKEKDMLSQYGRFGDDTISIIDGQPEHTNKLEDDIINRKGKVGEQFVKSLGSNTVNPHTGMDENFPWLAVGAAILGTLGAGAIHEYQDTGNVTLGGTWDYSLGNQGIAGGIRDFFMGDQDALVQQAFDTTNEGFETIGKQMEDTIGPDGSISRAAGSQLGNMQVSTGMETEALSNQYRTAISNTGMVSTADSQNINNKLQDLVALSDMKSKTVIDDKVSKTDAAVIDFNKQKNALLTAYLDTTGQTHPGSYALTDLQELLDQYEGQV